jgi:hypothetical protein
MPMQDWTISNSVETPVADWVYYVNAAAAFANIHFSRYTDDAFMDHMATNDKKYYYYGFTNTFNTAVPAAIAAALQRAWADYFTVR